MNHPCVVLKVALAPRAVLQELPKYTKCVRSIDLITDILNAPSLVMCWLLQRACPQGYDLVQRVLHHVPPPAPPQDAQGARALDLGAREGSLRGDLAVVPAEHCASGVLTAL